MTPSFRAPGRAAAAAFPASRSSAIAGPGGRHCPAPPPRMIARAAGCRALPRRLAARAAGGLGPRAHLQHLAPGAALRARPGGRCRAGEDVGVQQAAERGNRAMADPGVANGGDVEGLRRQIAELQVGGRALPGRWGVLPLY